MLRTGLSGTALRSAIASKSLLEIISRCFAVCDVRSDPRMAQHNDEGHDKRADNQQPFPFDVQSSDENDLAQRGDDPDLNHGRYRNAMFLQVNEQQTEELHQHEDK